MPLEYIPREHIEYLYRRALKAQGVSSKASDKLVGALNFKDQGKLQEILDEIDPALAQHLADIWLFFGQRALLAWTLPFLEGADVNDALALAGRRTRAGRGGAWVRALGAATSTTPATVRRWRVVEDRLEVMVQLFRSKTVTYDGEETPMPSTVDVPGRIVFSGETPLLELYASYNDARAALFGLLDWLRGTRTPRDKGAEQEKILLPLAFSRRNISKLAKSKRWNEPTAVKGIDPAGECGEVAMSGMMDGHTLRSLDVKHAKVQAQVNAPNVTERYAFRFTHPDGYVENPQVSFHFAGKQSRIQFHQRTSRLAMDWLMSAVRDELEV